MNKLGKQFKSKKFDLNTFKNDIYEHTKNEPFEEKFDNGDSLYHRLVESSLNSLTIIKCIYILSDAGFDINIQNDIQKQTCLHVAVMKGLHEIIHCLLQNGADLTITDHRGLCAYNYARRLENKDTQKSIISKMQLFYPTYWIGIDNQDMNIIRRLVNSWCKYKIKKNSKSLIDYAKEKKFKSALELFASLESQMDLCYAVFACNLKKVETIIQNNSMDLKMNFRNMRDKGATIMVYAIRENNLDLLKLMLKTKINITNDYCLDELDIDYPIYFSAIESNLSEECFNLLTPEVNRNKTVNVQTDISHLFYKGMSLLRYGIEVSLDIDKLRLLMQPKYCSNELITVKDPGYLTSKEYAILNEKMNYAELIDEITVDYILNDKNLRMQLALNGYDFTTNVLKKDNQNLLNYAKEKNLTEVVMFLENVELYQKKIDEFHQAVDKNDYHMTKLLYKIEINSTDSIIFKDLFLPNLICSKKKNESQTVLFKAVLNGYYEIVNLLLDLILENQDTLYIKLDQVRDHCYRTPMHYASGSKENKRMIQLLSQFGFSDNVFDYLGNTPLDFQERKESTELQDLIKMHRSKDFENEEPNPWAWQVWTRIQREKDTLKQLISVSHPHLHLGAHSHGHSHSHGHGHSHSLESQVKDCVSRNPLKPFNDLNEAKGTYEDNVTNNLNCILM